MTIAALDNEMRAKESVFSEPIKIRTLFPAPRLAPPAAIAGGATLLLGFKLDVDPRFFPGGNSLKIRLEPNGVGSLEVVNGKGGLVSFFKVIEPDPAFLGLGEIFDPALSLFQDKTNVRVTRDPHLIFVKAISPGDAIIHTRRHPSRNTLALEIRAQARGVVPGQPPTKTPPGRRFVSSKDSEPCENPTRSGRPVNPKGGGRKINLRVNVRRRDLKTMQPTCNTLSGTEIEGGIDHGPMILINLQASRAIPQVIFALVVLQFLRYPSTRFVGWQNPPIDLFRGAKLYPTLETGIPFSTPRRIYGGKRTPSTCAGISLIYARGQVNVRT